MIKSQANEKGTSLPEAVIVLAIMSFLGVYASKWMASEKIVAGPTRSTPSTYAADSVIGSVFINSVLPAPEQQVDNTELIGHVIGNLPPSLGTSNQTDSIKYSVDKNFLAKSSQNYNPKKIIDVIKNLPSEESTEANTTDRFDSFDICILLIEKIRNQSASPTPVVQLYQVQTNGSKQKSTAIDAPDMFTALNCQGRMSALSIAAKAYLAADDMVKLAELTLERRKLSLEQNDLFNKLYEAKLNRFNWMIGLAQVDVVQAGIFLAIEGTKIVEGYLYTSNPATSPSGLALSAQATATVGITMLQETALGLVTASLVQIREMIKEPLGSSKIKDTKDKLKKNLEIADADLVHRKQLKVNALKEVKRLYKIGVSNGT